MTNPYPIPRAVRQTDVLLGDGGATYGPFNFKIFDVEDVEVWTKGPEDEVFSIAGVTVSKVSGKPLDFFTITFGAAITSATEYVVRSARVAERSAGVEKGTQIDTSAMEKEFSKIATTLQELRRDIGRAFLAPFGEESAVISLDQIASAETYAEIAGSIAAAIEANSSPAFTLRSRAFAVANFHPTVAPDWIRTEGYYQIADGGGALYSKMGAPETVLPGEFLITLADGETEIRYGIARNQVLYPQMWGLRGLTKADLVTLNGAVGTIPADNAAAMEAAVSYLHMFGGGDLWVPAAIYPLGGAGVEERQGVRIRCEGLNDEREPTYPTGDEQWQGVVWLLYGTGEKHLTFPGITSGQHGGGWREDPDAPGTYYKVFSGYNSDADGTTPATIKEFSAGFWSVNQSYTGLEDCRIALWWGQNGLEGYDDPDADLTTAADWDFGSACIDGDRITHSNVQCVGPFRARGRILATTNSTLTSRMEKCKFTDLLCQGGPGALAVRSPDRWAIVASGADWFEIRHSDEHPFPNVYDAENPAKYRLGGGANNNLAFSYSTTSMNGANLRFNNVSPSPAAAFHIRAAGRGWAGTVVRSPHMFSLYHQGGKTLADLGIQKASIFEAAGYPFRGHVFDGKMKIHSSGRAGEVSYWQLWDAQDPYFSGVLQVEGGKWLFTTDVSTAVAYCSAPVGEVRNLNFLFSEGIEDLQTLGYLQQTHFPRTALDLSRQLGGRQLLDGHMHVMPHRLNKRLILHDDQLAQFMDCREITVTTAGFAFVTVTSQTCTWRFLQIGKIVFWKVDLTWSGLDTADTSNVSIRLPVDAVATALFNGTVNDRRSTGLNLGGVDNPYLDLATDNYLGISYGNTSQVAYTQMAAAGQLHASGSYWVN